MTPLEDMVEPDGDQVAAVDGDAGDSADGAGQAGVDGAAIGSSGEEQAADAADDEESEEDEADVLLVEAGNILVDAVAARNEMVATTSRR